jgi:hypothetical protein
MHLEAIPAPFACWMTFGVSVPPIVAYTSILCDYGPFYASS